MKKFRSLSATLILISYFFGIVLPLPVAVAASSFEGGGTYFWVRNVSKGETSFQLSTDADPGDEIDFFVGMQNSGVDTATETVLNITLPDITFSSSTAFAGWSTATYNLNDNRGEVIFAPHYLDTDGSGSVSAGDIRVNRYGINSASSGGKYLAGSTVVAGDYDDGDDLTADAVSNFYITGGNAVWAAGETVYRKGLGNNTFTAVEPGDIRVTATGSYLSGSIVKLGDTDVCTGCLTQANNIYRLDDGNDANNTNWPFDEGGLPIGDLGPSKPFYITVYDLAINISSADVLNPTFSATASNSSPATTQKSCTINVDTKPSIASVTFTPSVLKNDGTATTKVEVLANDKNGGGDIQSVAIDLSLIGGSAATTLYDDGSHGDTTAGDKIWSLSGITTTATAGSYIALTATATDFESQIATKNGQLVVQDSTAPVITINSLAPDTVGSSGNVTLNWKANEGIWRYELRMNGCSGNLLTGSNVSLGDGSSQILAANTAVNSVLDNSNFSAGANSIYICTTDADSNVGQIFTTATKDLTAPTVNFFSMYPGTITTGGSSTATWSADEAGTYEVRVGSCSGNLITGANASGSYTSGNVESIVQVYDLDEGLNQIHVCFTDLYGNFGSDLAFMQKDTIPPDPVSSVVLADNDTTHDGIDGFDLSVNWTPAGNDTSFSHYRIYVLPEGTAFDADSQTPLKYLAGQSSASWTGDTNQTVDSAGDAFVTGNYVAYIVSVDNILLTSSGVASAPALIYLDDLSPPTLDSAATYDTDTLLFTFSEGISFLDPSKLSASGITVDTAYNSDGFTNGVKINDSNTKQVFVRVATLATDFTASDLVFSACAFRDITGLDDLNEAGNCTDLAPVTNANVAANSLAISDGVGPALTLTTPTTDGTDNASVAVDYTLSETAQSGSIELKFSAVAGNADSASPHTLVLNDTLVGGDAEASGNHVFSFNGADFYSLQNGNNDSLVDGAVYTVELNATDLLGNSATPIQNTNWTYDTTPPTPPVAIQNFSSPTAGPTPEFNWSSVADAESYRVEVSLQSTNFVPAFASHSIVSPATNWVLDPAFADDGSNDDTYIWRVFATDFAGNESGPSNQLTFVLNTQTDTPTVILQDQTNNSQTHTNSQTVDAIIDSYTDDVTHYILSETQNTQPAVGSLDWVAIPGVAQQTIPFTFATADEETKTVYAWVKDSLDNISSVAASASIVLDTTAPTAPSLTTSDANGGAQAGKTNNATISVVITNPPEAVQWCILSDDFADGVPADPDESNCTAPAGGSATGWVASKPNTHTLASTGNKNVYVWVQDSAGNVSSVSPASTIEFSDTIPPDPTLLLSDQTSGDTNFTNSRLVDISASNAGTVWKWIIDVVPSGQPAENSLDWSDKPVTLELPAGDGTKTVYAWVKDAFGNISANQVSVGIFLDETDPTIAAQKTLDLDGDHQIDALRITMLEPILDTSIVLSDFTLSAGYTLANFTGSLSTVSFSGGVGTGSSSNDEIFYLAVSESGSTDTGITPNLTYTKGSLTDRAENLLQTGTAVLADGVAPVATAVNLLDTNSNGKIETARITFSEAINDSSINPGEFSISGNIASSASSGTANDNVFDIIITNEVAANTLADLIYTPGSLADLAGNLALAITSSDIIETDSVGPSIISVSYNENSPGVADDTITITFSEPINDASLDLSDFIVTGGGSLGTGSTISTGTANDNQITIILDGAGASPLTVGSSGIGFSGTGVVEDAVNDADGPAGNTQTTAITVNGAVVFSEILWGGTSASPDDEYIELRNMSSAPVDISGWVIENAGTSGASLTLPGGSVIPANGYFLIANYAETDPNSTLNVTPDWVTTVLDLADSGNGDLILRDTNGVIIDIAEGDTWPAGTADPDYASMERDEAPGDGSDPDSWHTAVASENLDDPNQSGTPGTTNIADNQAPVFVGSSYLPVHQSLLPASPALSAVSFADDAGGVGVDSASVIFTIDGNACANLSASTTRASCNLINSILTAGKHTVFVSVADLAGNTNSTSWDFWVDSASFTVEHLDADLGLVQPGFPGFTDDNAYHTKITVQTYGARFSVYGNPQSAMTSGAVNFPWHTNNTTVAGVGTAWRVKETASGSFANYYNFNDANEVARKIEFTPVQLASTNALQTYVFYVQNYAGVDALQAAGNYSQNINFEAVFTY